MQLRRLQGLERDKIEKEYNELQKNHIIMKSCLRRVLRNTHKRNDGDKDKYGDERKTEIAVVEDEIEVEDLIDEEECIIPTHPIIKGSRKHYKSQRRAARAYSNGDTRGGFCGYDIHLDA
jgi:DNA gyrase subunit A